jgi:hypothetical protein
MNIPIKTSLITGAGIPEQALSCLQTDNARKTLRSGDGNEKKTRFIIS